MKLYKFIYLLFFVSILSFTTIVNAEEVLSIISASPVDNVTNVSVNIRPSFIFSQPVDPVVLTNNSIQLREYAEIASEAKKVPANVELSEDKTVVTLIPITPLEYGKRYYLYADSGVKDVNGIQLLTENRWLHSARVNHDFTTELTSYIEGIGTIFKNGSFVETLALENGGVYTFTEAGSPYKFSSSLIVKKDIILNAEPGARIEIANHQWISIQNGQINFNGTVDKPVVITSDPAANTPFLNFIVSSDDPTIVPKVNLANVVIENGENCFVSQKNAVSVLTNVTLGFCKNAGITAFAFTDLTVQNLKSVAAIKPLTSFVYIGFTSQTQAANPMKVGISKTDFIQDGFYSIKISDQSGGTYDPAAVTVAITDSVFSGNVKDVLPVLIDHTNQNLSIIATDNYWGTDVGPYTTGVPSNQKTNGPQVPVNVQFNPFKTRNPATIQECCSSVIFIPGIQGSRLYTKDITNFDGEDQLWEPNWRSDLTGLGMDENGNSLNSNIYTRDIIERTNVVNDEIEKVLGPLDKNVYTETINYLKSQQESNIISSYAVYSYDWRLDFDEIIHNGTKQEDGRSQKLVELLRAQANISSTGKVTIVAHSMGGLLTKRFVQTLSHEDQKLIENVVLVASPQIGTPQGSLALLHGLAVNKFKAFLMPERFTRKLSENMITAHALTPSDAYFERVTIPAVIFADSVYNEIPSLSQYAGVINNGEEMRAFLTGQEGRINADFMDVNYPNISASIPNSKAKVIHDHIDPYIFPEDIEIVQIVGFGVPTLKKLEYVQKEENEDMFVPSYVQYKTLGGDNTVVYESAAYMDAPTYYVNLSKYNKDNGVNIDHQTIVGMSPVTEILTSIINNQTLQTNSYITESIGVSSARSLFSIGMHSPVDIHLYDMEGRHTGPVYLEIDGEAVKFIEENIPNTVYEEHGEEKYIYGIDDANYTLKLDGYAEGSFTLDVYKFTDDVETSYQTFSNLPATTELTSTISLTQNMQIPGIMLDTNGDLEPDMEVKSDGTIVDFSKPAKPQSNAGSSTTSSGGGFVQPSIVVPISEITIPINNIEDSADMLPLKTITPVSLTKKPAQQIIAVKSVIKNDIIQSVQPVNNTESSMSKARRLQLASVANFDFGKKFNFIEFIKRLFKWKRQ